MQTEYSKIYFLIKEDVDIGHALLACAHGAMMCMLKYHITPEFNEYLTNSFRKCVCKVTNKEFEAAKQFEDYVIVTESALENTETALVFKPRKEWPKAFKFYKLWKNETETNKYKDINTDKLFKELENETDKKNSSNIR